MSKKNISYNTILEQYSGKRGNMSNQRNLLVGLDFSDDYTQISCYNTKYYEPESISTSEAEDYLIPTALCVTKDTKEWLYGDEAMVAFENNEGILIDHLEHLAKRNEEVTVFDTKFKPSTLLEKYFRKVLSLLKKKYVGGNIIQLVVTVEDGEDVLAQNIYEAMRALGIEKDRVIVKSHAATSMYYVLNQNKDLWMNDVEIFHYNGHNLYFYHISINRRTKPCAVTVSKEDFTASFGEIYTSSATSTKQHKDQLAYLFHRIAKTTLSRGVISTLFITGKGFEDDWIDQTLQELCLGRRIFKGQNLYTKGACYMAKEMKGEKKLEDYILLSEEMLHSRVWMSAYVDAKVQEVVLAKIGTPWYEVNEEIELIFDGKPEVAIHCKSLFGRDTDTYRLVMDNLPFRPNKMTRAGLSLKCSSSNCIDVELRDLGFGDLYPATDLVCRIQIPLT